MGQQAQGGRALLSMMRSMDAFLVMIVLLGGLLCTAIAAYSGLYTPERVCALGLLNMVIAAVATSLRAGNPLALAGWQVLVATAVMVAAVRPAGDQLLATDHLITVAAAITTFRGTWTGHAGMAALIGLSTVVASNLVGTQQALSAYLHLLCFYAVMIAVYRVIVSSATRTDHVMELVLGAQRAAVVTEAVRRDREERARMLHDTVLATLTAVAQGVVTDPEHVRTRCAADLERLNRPTLLGELIEGADLTVAAVSTAIRGVVAEATHLGLTIEVHQHGIPAGGLPVQSADALLGAATEALTNVRRHAGVAEAELTVHWSSVAVRMRISDRGRGFDAVQLMFGMGLRQSILARVRAAGGTADIRSRPGAGTTVEIAVPTAALRSAATRPAALR